MVATINYFTFQFSKHTNKYSFEHEGLSKIGYSLDKSIWTTFSASKTKHNQCNLEE